MAYWFNVRDDEGEFRVSYSDVFYLGDASKNIGIYAQYNKLVLYVDNMENKIKEIEVASQDVWHFIGLSWEYIYDNGHKLHYYIKLDEVEYEASIDIEEEFTISSNYYYYGSRPSGSDNFYANIAGLIMSTSGFLSSQDIKEYYNLTKLYLINTKNEDSDYSTKIEYSDLEGYKIYPLHGSFNSLDNEKPIYEDLRYPITDKRLSFNYNKEVKRYVFDALCGKINYSFGNSNKFTIGMRVYPYDVEALQYLFSGIDSDGNGISLYIDTDNYVKIKHNEGVINTLKTLNKNVWSTVILTYDLSISENDNIIMSINGNLYRGSLNPLSSSLKNTIIGSDYNYQNPFNGQMEMIITKNDYINISSIYSLSSQFSVRSITNGYDSLGRISFKNIKATANILNTEYTYKEITDTDNNKVPLPKVDKEVITTNSLSAERSYSYGSSINKNNITYITDSVFGNKEYTYDNRGFLTNDNGTSISYDSNGNILSYGGKTYIYDATIKDRLMSVGGYAITYSSSNPLLPAVYKDMYFTYEGNRLTCVEKAYDSETTIYYRYYYNYEGLRIKKVETHEYTDDRDPYIVTTYHYYEGNRLITEYRSDTDRIDYLYDSNGLLYGFINNKTERFYYVRDILQNILGIVDTNGNLVVKYDCNAYGDNQTITGSNTTIGLRNPFRYKGYYYDEETGLFMVGHRYYNPQWGRWIQPDDVEYLEPDNINGLNLYCYCNNNPVNYYDPDGHSALLIIGLIIGAAIGFGGAAYIDYQDDGEIFNGSVKWYDYLGATVLGGAIGAGLGAFAGMSFSASIPTFGWINSGGALMFGITGTMAVTVTGAQVLGVAGALAAGGLLMFAKGNGPRMGHNQYENKQFNSLCNKYKLTKEQRRILHDYISGQNYSYHEIEQIIKELFFS